MIQALDLLKRRAVSKLRDLPRRGNGSDRRHRAGSLREAVFERTPRDASASTGSLTSDPSWRPCATSCAARRIWVVGANRYRNPDDDLPADFEAQRTPYYQALKLPSRSGQLHRQSPGGNARGASYRRCRHAAQSWRQNQPEANKEAWITVTPFDPQPDPPISRQSRSRNAGRPGQ